MPGRYRAFCGGVPPPVLRPACSCSHVELLMSLTATTLVVLLLLTHQAWRQPLTTVWPEGKKQLSTSIVQLPLARNPTHPRRSVPPLLATAAVAPWAGQMPPTLPDGGKGTNARSHGRDQTLIFALQQHCAGMVALLKVNATAVGAMPAVPGLPSKACWAASTDEIRTLAMVLANTSRVLSAELQLDQENLSPLFWCEAALCLRWPSSLADMVALHTFATEQARYQSALHRVYVRTWARLQLGVGNNRCTHGFGSSRTE